MDSLVLVAQRIEQVPSKDEMKVRFLPGTLKHSSSTE